MHVERARADRDGRHLRQIDREQLVGRLDLRHPTADLAQRRRDVVDACRHIQRRQIRRHRDVDRLNPFARRGIRRIGGR